MTKLKVIYEPKGKAREYAELAINLFETCQHGCLYCYAPRVLHKKPEDFFAPLRPRKDIIPKLISDARQLKATNDQREILLCFTCDPYQSDRDIHDIGSYTTRSALVALLNANLNISILTKGGKRSLADIELLEHYADHVRYGASLTFTCDRDSLMYEPNAAPTSERIQVLETVHNKGIRTWVSIEPAWSISDTLRIIEKTHRFVDLYMIGKLNYHPHVADVDWYQYTEQVVEKLQELDKNFYLKQDLKNKFYPSITLKNEIAQIGSGL